MHGPGTIRHYSCVTSALDVSALIFDLYQGDLDDFIVRRAAAATTAKDAGDTATARGILTLRRPSLAAHTINHLPHEDMEALTTLSKALREDAAAQETQAAGADPIDTTADADLADDADDTEGVVTENTNAQDTDAEVSDTEGADAEVTEAAEDAAESESSDADDAADDVTAPEPEPEPADPREELIADIVSRTKVSSTVREEIRQTLRAAFADEKAADAVASRRLMRAIRYKGYGEVDLTNVVARSDGTRQPRRVPGAKYGIDLSADIRRAERALDKAENARSLAQRRHAAAAAALAAAQQAYDAATSSLESASARVATAKVDLTNLTERANWSKR